MLHLSSVTRPPYCKTADGNLCASSGVSASFVTLWKSVSSQSCDWYLNYIFIYLTLGNSHYRREEAVLASRNLLHGIVSIQI